MSEESGINQGQAVMGAWVGMLLLLGFCTMQRLASPVEQSNQTPMAPCSAEGSVFAAIPYELDRDVASSPIVDIPAEFNIACVQEAVLEANGIWETQSTLAIVDVWPRIFHACVRSVIEAHRLASTGQDESPGLACLTDDEEGREPPTPVLLQLAMTLPPWRPGGTWGLFAGPPGPPNLSETDMTPVLEEFVRIYECSMLEFIQEALPYEGETMGLFTERNTRQADSMREELATARDSVERTLLLLGSLDRLRPLLRPLRCFLQASVDIRNAFGLFSEATSCMPRTWDPFTELRDPPPYEDEEEE